jgi:hypothetical protein
MTLYNIYGIDTLTPESAVFFAWPHDRLDELAATDGELVECDVASDDISGRLCAWTRLHRLGRYHDVFNVDGTLKGELHPVTGTHRAV